MANIQEALLAAINKTPLGRGEYAYVYELEGSLQNYVLKVGHNSVGTFRQWLESTSSLNSPSIIPVHLGPVEVYQPLAIINYTPTISSPFVGNSNHLDQSDVEILPKIPGTTLRAELLNKCPCSIDSKNRLVWDQRVPPKEQQDKYIEFITYLNSLDYSALVTTINNMTQEGMSYVDIQFGNLFVHDGTVKAGVGILDTHYYLGNSQAMQWHVSHNSRENFLTTLLKEVSDCRPAGIDDNRAYQIALTTLTQTITIAAASLPTFQDIEQLKPSLSYKGLQPLDLSDELSPAYGAVSASIPGQVIPTTMQLSNTPENLEEMLKLAHSRITK
jgi:hypothetical protein